MSRSLMDDYLHAAVLQREIEILRSRLQPHDTGHLHTAISVLESRVVELFEEPLAINMLDEFDQADITAGN